MVKEFSQLFCRLLVCGNIGKKEYIICISSYIGKLAEMFLIGGVCLFFMLYVAVLSPKSYICKMNHSV